MMDNRSLTEDRDRESALTDAPGREASPHSTNEAPAAQLRRTRLRPAKGETPSELHEESRRWDAGLTRQTAVITAAGTVAGTLIGVALGVIGAILWAQLTSADTTLARLVIGAFLGGGGGSLLAFMIGGPLAVKRIRKEHRAPGDIGQSKEQSKEGW